jgi:hypothetical protein
MKRSFAHITPRYIVDKARARLNQKIHPDWPWLAADAVRALDSLLWPADIGFEWGMGRSTLWFARRVKKIVSVEQTREWFEKVRRLAREQGLDNVELVVHEIKDPAAPVDDDHPYIAEIDRFPDNYFGFILIDGNFRGQCALKALNHLQSHGLLIVDNIQRYLPNDQTLAPKALRSTSPPHSRYWTALAERVAGWRRMWLSDGVSDTAIWFKP